MSVAFTTPSGQTLQSLAFYNELQRAYSERVQALGNPAQTLFSEGAYWQKLSMYQGWQNWLINNCIYFIDHINGPLNPGHTDFLYFTVQSWKVATNLTNGFSRYDKDGNFIGYGIAQDNDMICDKLFLELQAGFGALKVRPVDSTIPAVPGQWQSDQAGGGDWTFAGAVTESSAEYNLYGPHSWIGAPYSTAWTNVDNRYYDGELIYLFYEVQAHNGSGSFMARGYPVIPSVTHNVSLYLMGVRHPENSGKYPSTFNSYGLGLVENQLVLKYTSGSITASSWTSPLIDPGVGTPPNIIAPPLKEGCTSGETEGHSWSGCEWFTIDGFIISQYKALIEYNFTNA